MTQHYYGWHPDGPDHRDYTFTAPPAFMSAPLPTHVDLRPNMPKVYNQLTLGSCTANAIAGALEYDRMKQGLDVWTPSRLLIYYMERSMEGTIDSDAGAAIRDGVKVVNKLGCCPEFSWPYEIARFTEEPPSSVFADAKQHPAIKYESVHQDVRSIKTALAAGFPVIFGFTVYESFESDAVAKTGIVPMPAKHERALGGHAVLAVGYDDPLGHYDGKFIVRNSWGDSWGDKGYFYMPYGVLDNAHLSRDFWAVELVK